MTKPKSQKTGSAPEGDAKRIIWKTAIERAVFGFRAEVGHSEYWLNKDYLSALCDAENRITAQYSKAVFFSFALSLFSIATARDALGDASYLGLSIASIPYLSEFCILLLGVVTSLLVVFALDLHAMTRMRMELFAETGSESPNMRMVVMKGHNAWIDALLPKGIGYSSGITHKVFQMIGLVWAFSLPLAFFCVVLAAQIITFRSVAYETSDVLSRIIAFSGLALSTGGILIFLMVAVIPLRFRLEKTEPSTDE